MLTFISQLQGGNDRCSPSTVVLICGHGQYNLEESRLRQGEQGICALMIQIRKISLEEFSCHSGNTLTYVEVGLPS